MLLFKMALSNIFRNRRRAVTALLSILIGVSVISFTNGLILGLRNAWSGALIDGSVGHFRLVHPDYTEFASTDMERVLISDPENLAAILKENPHVVGVLPKINFGGLLGQEEKSTTFWGQAYDVRNLNAVLPDFEKNDYLKPDDPTGIIMGSLLAKSLNAKIGDELVVMSSSIYGESTAVIVTIRGLIDLEGQTEVSRNIIITDIRQIQNDLLDIGSGALELVVRLDDEENLEEVRQWVSARFEKEDTQWDTMPWYDDAYFKQTLVMFKGMGSAITLLISLVVGIVIANALLMNVFERIREIGTMRAVGAEKRQVYKIIYLEAFLTALIGVCFGLILGSVMIAITSKTGVHVPAGSWTLDFYPQLKILNVLRSAVFPIVVVLVAVWYPVRASCKLNVIEALNYR